MYQQICVCVNLSFLLLWLICTGRLACVCSQASLPMFADSSVLLMEVDLGFGSAACQAKTMEVDLGFGSAACQMKTMEGFGSAACQAKTMEVDLGFGSAAC